MNEEETAIVRLLKWSVQALAQPAHVQVTLFPPFVCLTDELALDLEHWLLVTQSQKLPVDQRALDAIAGIEADLRSLSGGQNSEFWAVEALASDDRWEAIRQKARAALALAGWEDEIPPTERAAYVSVNP